jgi:hypothetical protein
MAEYIMGRDKDRTRTGTKTCPPKDRANEIIIT